MSVEAREPRKIRRARTREAHWQARLAGAATPASRAAVAVERMRAALARPEVADKQRDRAWAEVAALAERITASVTPRNFTAGVHTAEFTGPEGPNAQMRARTRAREPQPADYSKSPTGGSW